MFNYRFYGDSAQVGNPAQHPDSRPLSRPHPQRIQHPLKMHSPDTYGFPHRSNASDLRFGARFSSNLADWRQLIEEVDYQLETRALTALLRPAASSASAMPSEVKLSIDGLGAG